MKKLEVKFTSNFIRDYYHNDFQKTDFCFFAYFNSLQSQESISEEFGIENAALFS